MNTKKEEVIGKPQAEEIVYPEQLTTYYSNVVRFFVGNFDFSFDFSIKDPRMSGNTVQEKTKVQVRVIMSPHHAKVFANLLITNLQEFEKRFGVINTEPVKKS